jgi:hypothetical protein
MAFKTIRFLDADGPFLEAMQSRWEAALAAGPAAGRPGRVALAVPLDLTDLPPPTFAAIDVQWFDEPAAAFANEDWLASVDPRLQLGSDLLGKRSCRVIAEEVVLRGPEYLDARWQQGGERFKMTSFGKRNPALTLPEFSARWRSQAGRLGDAEIPAPIRGLAYVQNHAVPVDGHEWPFDAINEVYFEQLDQLQRRRAYFAARQDAAARSAAESFVSPTRRWSMFVRECPVPIAVTGRSATR